MPRSSRTGELIFNLEIEKVERKLRKEAKQRKPTQVAKLAESLNHLRISSSSDSKSDQKTVMAEDTRTLRELAAPNLAQQPLCINFPTLNNTITFELKSGLIHLLPSFHGLAGEETHKHLQEFDVVCSSMKPPGVTDKQIKLRAFPFSLKDAAKDWLYYLPPGSIDTWNDMKKKFLEKYFPASRAAILRKEICGIKQQSGETLHEYWERFNKLIIKCPQHQIPSQLLIQYFYDGLSLMDRNIIDAASGGALVNKTPAQAWDLIARMAENTQQFGSRDVGHMSGNKNDHTIQSIQQQLYELTSFVRKMVVEKSNPSVQVKACGICTSLINQVSEEVKQLRERGKWPAQSEPNPANVSAITICSDTKIECSSRPNPKNTSAITLRSGKELEGPPPISKEQNKDQIEMEIEKEVELHEKKPQKANKRKEMMEIFKKLELNIPLLEAITQIPKYAKFLKELCTNKKKLREDEHIIAGENVSAVIKRKVPPKTGDPGIFSIPCKIGKTEITKAMLDLGAAINVMPRSIYDSLNLGSLKKTGIIIQLADRTHAYPDGMIEDVLVQVNELIFPVDFYILDMHDANCFNPPPLLLGRPFMCTAGTKIDVKKGTLSLEFDGEEFHFNIFNPVKCPVESESLYAINVINFMVQETCEVGNENKRRTVLTKQLEKRPTGESKKRKKIVEKWRWIPKGSPLLAAKKCHKENQNSKPKKKCVANRHRFKLYHEEPSLDPIKLAPVADFNVQN
ncbi:uncharacterized protein LOC127258426 [Andrographis paniculata]|uniref:uncharacterized protein LOC127258426 n=1 Tax=Andrographis paniculata TaxID=175694 RepID=UPI0021E75763|nr:uncharacterized protein LOC127258426 [Andrographis paniculata]